MLDYDFEQFISELDAAIQTHLEWSRRVLRCAVLRTSPGDDVLNINAHTLCRFYRWFTQSRAIFEDMDSTLTELLDTEHQTMHHAIRTICSAVITGHTGNAADLEAFESAQENFIGHLAYFKTLAITRNAHIDTLTGLPLRHRLQQDFAFLSEHTRRHDSFLVVMLVDADHFKSINDQHGHAAGDLVLQQLALTLKQTLRENDVAYRYGGEEFLLLLEVANPDGMPVAAQRVLNAVRELTILLPDGTVSRPTVTIGVANANNDDNLANVINLADSAMYDGKASGRNCFRIADF